MRAKANLVIVDVDAFGDGLSLAITNAERGEFCLGFYSGIRGTEGREDAGEHFRRGYGIGKELAFRQSVKKQKCTEAGRKGHVHRMERLGLLSCDNSTLHPTVHPTVIPHGAPYGESSNHQETHPTVHPAPPPDGAPTGDTTLFFVRNDSSKSENDLPPGEDVLLELPCQKGETYRLTRAELDRWKEAFPSLDGLQQARAMKFWLQAIPTRLKTLKGMPRFFSTWLGNAVKGNYNQPRNPVPLKTAKSKLDAGYMAANQDFFDGEVGDVPFVG